MPFLPGKMREGFIRFGHAVGIFADGYSCTLPVVGINEFVGKFLGQGLALALPDCDQYPTYGQGVLTFSADLNRDLVGRATNTARTDFEHRLYVFNRYIENFYWIGVFDTFADNGQGVVHHFFGHGFLAAMHDVVDELGQDDVVEPGVANEESLSCFVLLSHRWGWSMDDGK